MTGQNFSGKNYKMRMLDGILIHGETATLNITDNSAVAQTGGLPNGMVDGDVAADGEIVLDTVGFNTLMDYAAKYGSFQAMPAGDISFYAGSDGFEQHIEAYGCKLKISALLNLDSKGGSKHTHTIPFVVTSPDFVRINGIPYIDPEESKEIATYAN